MAQSLWTQTATSDSDSSGGLGLDVSTANDRRGRNGAINGAAAVVPGIISRRSAGSSEKCITEEPFESRGTLASSGLRRRPPSVWNLGGGKGEVQNHVLTSGDCWTGIKGRPASLQKYENLQSRDLLTVTLRGSGFAQKLPFAIVATLLRLLVRTQLWSSMCLSRNSTMKRTLCFMIDPR